jgi:8-oxo-dGTP diphosphatase
MGSNEVCSGSLDCLHCQSVVNQPANAHVPLLAPGWRIVLESPAQPAGHNSERYSVIDVRIVLFSIQYGELWVAMAQANGDWELPSVSLNPAESLDSAALRALLEKLGAEQRYIEQLYSLAIEDTAEPSVLIAYLGIAEAGASQLSVPGADWKPALSLPEVPAIDARIVDYALVRLRAKLGYTTIAFHLLPMSFSLSELQQVYEIVLGRALDKRNFRRRIQSAEILDATRETRRDGSHRPARLYRFRSAHDADTYLTPVWAAAPDGEPGNS